MIKKKNVSKLIFNRNDIFDNKHKKIVLCHGVFDVFHVGHLMHLKNAKSHGDILVVSITADKFVKKGPNRPFFNQSYRALFLSSLEIVDYVYISKSATADKVLNDIRPDFYAKGEEYSNEENDLSKNIILEKKIINKIKGKMIYTHDKKFSSTDILNNIYDIFSLDQKNFLSKLKKKYNTKKILDIIENFSKLEVTLVGDALFDIYCYVNTLGLTAKNPTISSEYLYKENYYGGVLATAQMMASLGVKVNLILYNHKNNITKNLLKNLDKSIKIIFINSKNKKNIIPSKTRFINKTRDVKLFQVSNINQIQLSEKEQNEFLMLIKRSNSKNNFLIILDFGFGVFESKLIKNIDKISKNIFLNVQTNSNNFGFNYFTKYKNFKYLSADKREFEFAMNKKIELNKLRSSMYKKKFTSITLGENGSIFYNKKDFYKCPSFFLDAKDTTGCGDAYFIITSLLIKMGYKDQIIPFLGNCYAGLHSKIVGNKSFPSKIDLTKTIITLLT